MQSGKDQTAHTKLKYRQPGQGAPTELKNLKKDFKTDLERRETIAADVHGDKDKTTVSGTKDVDKKPMNLLLMNVDDEVVKKFDDRDAVHDDRDDDFESSR